MSPFPRSAAVWTARFGRLALSALALHAGASRVWAEVCDGAPPGHKVCSTYSGSISLADGGKRCLSGYIFLEIFGPTTSQTPTTTGFGYANNNPDLLISILPSCPLGGHFEYRWNAVGGEGTYAFLASHFGYRGTGPIGSATCGPFSPPPSDSFCTGGFSGTLYPIEVDEEPHCRECPNVGKPVNVMTGNVWFDHADAQIPGLGPGLSLVRSYNSRLARLNRGGAFGRGWWHPHEQKLTQQAVDLVMIRTRDGSPIWFEDFDENGSFAAMLPKDETSSVVKNGQGYVRSLRAGGSETYDLTGRLLNETDAAGNVTAYTYDGDGLLTTVTEAGGRTLTFAYNSAGRITSASGPLGVLATYTYDSTNRLEAVVYPDGGGYRYAYDSLGQILSVLDAEGAVVETHTYDSQGRGITSSLGHGQERMSLYYGATDTLVADANGDVTRYEWENIQGISSRVTRITGGCSGCGTAGKSQSWSYDEAGRVVTETDGLGNTTTYGYNGAGDRVLVTNPLNQTTTYTYDAQGRVLTETRPDGGLTTYTHSAPGPLTIQEKVTASTNRTTTIAYTAQGKPQTLTDPRSKVTTLGYNSFGDLTSVQDPLSHTTTFGYDAMGRRTTVTDALSHTTTTVYDTRGRVSSIVNHDSTHTDFAYDLAGRRRSVTDPKGNKTEYAYDAVGRLKHVIDALGQATTYSYDAMSQLVALKDAKGNTTTFEYDHSGHVSRVIYPGGAAENFVYDDAGRLAKKTDRKGTVTTYAYDAASRLTGKTYSDGTPPVTYTYDTVGRLLTAANGTDTLTWTYDLAGQLLTEQSSKNASTVAYTYDLAGNRLTLGLDGTLFVTYAYDDASRLTTITRGSSAFGFGYDNANRRTSMSYPNGINTSYTYDNLNRLTRLKADLSSTPITDFQYLYDAAGNRTRKQQLDYTEDYSYDALYRLIGAERTAGLIGIWHWGYDAVGNRVTNQINDSVLTAAFNEKNQLTSSSGGGTLKVRGTLNEPGSAKVNGNAARMLAGNVFEATIQATSGNNTFAVEATDVSGNITNKNYQVSVSATGATYTYDSNGNLSTKTEGTDTWVYTWNAENQLTKVEKNSVEQARFGYDPLGRRVEKVAGGVTTTYTYDRLSVLREVRGATSLRYLHGPGIDEPLAVDDGTALSYFHADVLGSATKTTSAAGAVTVTRRYDAWGNLEMGGSEPGYAFTGREWDPETELYYYRARHYDPRTGRFLSEDPLPLGFRGPNELNPYAYVAGNPVRFTDPTGLEIFPNGVPIPPPPCDPPGNVFDLARGFEAKHFPGQADPYGGGYRHCVSACLLKRRYGPMANVMVNWWDLIYEGSSKSPSTTNSESDMAAEQHGLICARKRDCCERECLKIYRP